MRHNRVAVRRSSFARFVVRAVRRSRGSSFARFVVRAVRRSRGSSPSAESVGGLS